MRILNPRIQIAVVPDIGVAAVYEVIDVNVAYGDKVCVGQTLITVKTEKAVYEIPSLFAGEAFGFELKVGDKVAVGQTILLIDLGEYTSIKICNFLVNYCGHYQFLVRVDN